MILGLGQSNFNRELFPVVLKLLPTNNKIVFQKNLKQAQRERVINTEAGFFKWTPQKEIATISSPSVGEFVSFALDDFVQLPRCLINKLPETCAVTYPDEAKTKQVCISISCTCNTWMLSYDRKNENQASISLTLEDLMHDEEEMNAGMCSTVIRATPQKAVGAEARMKTIGLGTLKSKYVVIDERGYQILDSKFAEAESTPRDRETRTIYEN
ncbi:hypothetical protein ABG067_005130 [Albugo candida]